MIEIYAIMDVLTHNSGRFLCKLQY